MPRHTIDKYFGGSFGPFVVAKCFSKGMVHRIELQGQGDHVLSSYYLELAFRIECKRCSRVTVMARSDLGRDGVICRECRLDAEVIDLNLSTDIEPGID